MSAARASSIAQLLSASFEDEQTLAFEVPSGIFGQHAQAAVEKLLKALLTAHGRVYPFKHDLVLLHSLLVQCGETLPSFQFHLEDLTEFAGQMRYEQPLPFSGEERSALREDIRLLREFCLLRIEALFLLPE